MKELRFDRALKKINRKIDNLAEASGMTRQEFEEWSDRETYRTEISDKEYLYIRAYKINEAKFKLISEGKHKQATLLEKKFFWIDRLHDLDEKAPGYIKHLVDVCNYCESEYGREYELGWLVNFEDDVYDKILKETNESGKPRLKK